MKVYAITNLLNGKVYVGQTTQPLEYYLYQQGWRARSSKYAKPKLYAAIRKYGIENFKIESLLDCESHEEMNFAEIAFIYALQTQLLGYNLADGGGGRSGVVPWNKGKKCPQISAWMFGNTNSIGNHPVRTQAQKDKISATLRALGIRPTLEGCAAGGRARQAKVGAGI